MEEEKVIEEVEVQTTFNTDTLEELNEEGVEIENVIL